MTLREAIERFKERCENNPKIQELKERLIAEAKARQVKAEERKEA